MVYLGSCEIFLKTNQTQCEDYVTNVQIKVTHTRIVIRQPEDQCSHQFYVKHSHNVFISFF